MNKFLLIGIVAAVVLLVVAVPFVTAHADDQTMPAVGQTAPTFTLPSQTGSRSRSIAIAASGWFSTSIPRT